MSDAPSTPQEADDGVDETAEAAEASVETRFGCPVLHSDIDVLFASRDQWYDVARQMLADGFRMCVDLTAVDYLTYVPARNVPAGVETERFEVVATFLCHQTRERLRIKAQVPESDPTIDSLHVLYPGSDYLEREVYDMFGISFEGHPDLSRILMPESWVGHPLRKDFDIGAIPVQFKGTK